MKWRPVYMKIDYAHAGIPEYIADSPTELAALCGVGLSTISHSLATQKKEPTRQNALRLRLDTVE